MNTEATFLTTEASHPQNLLIVGLLCGFFMNDLSQTTQSIEPATLMTYNYIIKCASYKTVITIFKTLF